MAKTVKQAVWPELIYGSQAQIATANTLRVKLLKQIDGEIQEAIDSDEWEDEAIDEMLHQRNEIIQVRNANFWINEKGRFFLNDDSVEINAYYSIEEYERR